MMNAEAIYRRSPPWLQGAMLNAFALRIQMRRYGPPFRKALDELQRMERADPAAIRRHQDERLREIIRYAGSRSPFHRERWAAEGIDPTTISGVEDLHRLPLLTKQDVRENQKRLLTSSTPRRSWLHGHTSGTTGSPLSLWYDRRTVILTTAVDARQKLWGGLEGGDWLGILLGRVVVPIRQKRPPYWRTNHVQRQVWFSTFHLDDETLPAYVDEMRRRKLRFLEGYPSTLYILARHLLRQGERLPLAAAFSSSETLHTVQRETIEDAFGCRLYDFYGHAERTIFASECEEHAGKHLAELYGYTEVVDATGQRVPDGEVGYLVGTSLHNTAMPLIRYRTGDISAIVTDPCACGRTLRRIRSVTTKAEDILVTPDGRFVSPSVLTHPFKPYDQISESQLIQERLDMLRVRVVAGHGFGTEQEKGLLQGLHDRLGDDMEIRIDRVDHIPREPSGKFRWVISRLDHSLQFSWEDDQRSTDIDD